MRHLLVGIRLFVALPLGVVLLVGLALAQPFGSAAANPPNLNLNEDPIVGDLELAQRSDEILEGTFTYEGTTATFVAQRTSEPTELTASSSVHVDVDGFGLDVSSDAVAKQIVVDGHGQRISTEQVKTFLALHNSLSLEFSRDYEHLPVHVDLLIRVTNFFSGAPVGVEVGTMQIDGVITNARDISESPNYAELIAGDPAKGAFQAEIVEHCAALSGDASLAACQMSDDDGVTYLPCPVDGYHVNSHDAASHCFSYFWEISGQCSDGCRGRCGSGCPPITQQHVYTQDCADHDSCCRSHGGGWDCVNPWDDSCGDEWQEAADDFLQANLYCGVFCA